MKAAVVTAFDRPPKYDDSAEPVAQPGEVIVHTRAAALTQLVRAQASGKHYSSGTAPFPFVPGADGVGKLADGRRVYFAFPRPPIGTMAQRVAVKESYCIAVPDELDDVTAAAAANPGMSSWAALSERADLQRGESVLINGATGAAGKLAIQIAKHLGAGRVIATGRNRAVEAELRALGADSFIPLTVAPELTEAFRKEIATGIDVVLDYLYGPSAEAFLAAATGHGSGEAARRTRFVNIGSLGGNSIALPAAALRSSGIELTGSGLGSVSNVALIRVIGELMRAIIPAKLQVQAEAVPLERVETTWTTDTAGRVVFTL